MSTRTATRPHPAPGRRPNKRSRSAIKRAEAARTTRRRKAALWTAVAVGLVALVTAMMWSSRGTSDATSRPAPDFTLTDTSGKQVHLADLRGQTVVLYFNEGAGCQSCLLQMVDIERNAGRFTAEGVTVLPIVMNSADRIRADMAANGVRTPFLLDDGTVSAAYGTLGKGMHAGLPGHSFVLIDAQGTQRWYGEYPSMYLSASGLLDQIHKHLP